MKNIRRLFSFVTVLVIAGTTGLIWNKRLAIHDWSVLRNYSPPSKIVTLANQDTMNSYAKHMLYINHPLIQEATQFNQSCSSKGREQTIVLGCYHGNQTGLFVFNVKDPKLNGVVQVTLAHEALHAIYDRLSTSQKNHVDTLLLDYYKHDLHDKRILSTIAAYKKSEPDEVVNEMHSVFGTEVLSLPPALENYYKQYFSNRHRIASYAQSYQAVFTNQRLKVQSDDAKLASLKNLIDTDEARLTPDLVALKAQQTQMKQLLADKQYAAYNAQVSDFNAKAASYNSLASTVRDLISQYNTLLIDRNNLVVQAKQLLKAIDSRPNNVSSQ